MSGFSETRYINIEGIPTEAERARIPEIVGTFSARSRNVCPESTGWLSTSQCGRVCLDRRFRKKGAEYLTF